MVKKQKPKNTYINTSRRSMLAATGACFAMMSQQALSTMLPAPMGKALNTIAPKATFTKDAEVDGMVEITGIHQGKGVGKAKFFRFANTPWPAHFMIYDLPPGASEGVHIHFLDDRNKEGAFDEYYYIISGQGQMEIDGQIVPIKKGDHIHTPLEVAHGVENTHPDENLRVFLTFIERGKAHNTYS
ncbi:cupin domain-containing protein [Kordiimonas pumila]|uniref:Cupin domain-containing protein n=1 Tax=Kordiimonas pumila TaxID=2161677 RepID=A0ABV7D1L1_9PROT|nr:cupin domain-containing protein [Kordiimonas pumila]